MYGNLQWLVMYIYLFLLEKSLSHDFGRMKLHKNIINIHIFFYLIKKVIAIFCVSKEQYLTLAPVNKLPCKFSRIHKSDKTQTF